MAIISADRVRDTSTTTGTGAFAVSGTAPTGYRTFSAVMSVSDTCRYTIQNNIAGEWEVGWGTYSAANTLTRTTVLSSSNSGSLVSFTAGTKDVFITFASATTPQFDASGNLGVGTSSPGRLLTVGDGTGGKYAEVKGGNSGTSGGASLLVTLASTLSYAYGNKSSILGGAYDNTLLVYNGINSDTVFYTNNTERARIDSSGNVGVGTSSPSSPGGTINFVVSSTGTTIIKAQTSSTTTGTARYDYATGTANSYVIASLNDNTGSPYYILSAGAGVLTKYTDFTTQVWRNTGGGTERMRIDSSGNVGIGTSSPNNSLTVSRAGADVARFLNSGTNGGDWQLKIGGGGFEDRKFMIADRYSGADNVRMAIDSSGNVGIGTSSPSYALDVYKNSTSIAQFYYNDGTYNPRLQITGSSSGITLNETYSNSANSLMFAMAGTEKMRIDASGNVGIGTSSPTAGGKFDVNGIAYFGTADKLKLYSNNLLQTAGTLDIGTIGSAALIFDTANTERMRIDANGTVGIGTSLPVTKLHVETAALTDAIRWTDNINSTGILSTAAGLSTIWSTTALGFGTGGGSYSEKMRIDANGAVGIGGTPSITYEKLRVEGTESRIRSRNNTSGAEMYMGTITSNEGRVWASTNTPIAFGTNDTENMRIDASGNVLYGTGSTPVGYAKFRAVTGSCDFSFGPQTAGGNSFVVWNASTVGVYLASGNTSWSAISDEKAKNIIEPIADGLQKVNSLRTVIGSYKNDETNIRHPFLIAQDVQKVLPEAVDASNPDMLGVQYTDVIPLLVAAIQELSAKNDALEARLAKLENVQ